VASSRDNGFILVSGGYAARDVRTGEVHEFGELAALLPWRDNVLAPHEPRMPPHQYVVVEDLGDDELAACRMLELLIDDHPESFLAYFRGYRTPFRYLEIGDGHRYWRSRIRATSFVNRCRLDSSESPRRVDEGAEPIPRGEWGAKYPYWPRGSGYGEWEREGGSWVFRPEDPPA
jgi:hypothetical protein